MKRLVLASLAGLLLLTGCGGDQSTRDDLAPSKPTLVQRSSDREYPQRGIRAEPVQLDGLHYVRVEWYANPEPDIAGYRIYRGGEWEPLQRYPVDDIGLDELETDGDRYFWIDKGVDYNGIPADLLAPDSTGMSRGYYWWVVAYDEAGNRSEFSDQAYYRLLKNPTHVVVSRLGTNQYQLYWQFPESDVSERPAYAMLRIYRWLYGRDSLVYYQQYPTHGTDESVTMDFSTSPTALVQDCTYVAQINLIADQPNEAHVDTLAGSAAYATFPYQN